MEKSQIIGRIVIQATVTNITNLLIGSGDDDLYNFEMLKEEGAPFIPGTSFAGLLSKYAHKRVNTNIPEHEIAMNYLWGNGNDFQSHIMVDDLYFKKSGSAKYKFVSRDGVSINRDTGTEENKYDYEFLEPNAVFSMQLEVVVRNVEGVNTTLLKQIILLILKAGEDCKLKQGAFTSHDFGVLKFDDIRFHHFDFTKENDRQDAEDWFSFLSSGILKNEYGEFRDTSIDKLLSATTGSVYIKGKFTIKNTLMIGSENAHSLKEDLEKAHLENSNGESMLSSKSIRGAVRHRALRIMNTINNTDEKENQTVNNLFGYVNQQHKKLQQKGKIIAKEVNLGKSNFINTQVQNRIKVCRFTSGTIDAALFQQLPLYNLEQPFQFEINFEMEDCEDKQIGLMVLVMKDLISGDLAIGGGKNIGRGILVGTELTIADESGNSFNWHKDKALAVTGDKFSVASINQYIQSLKMHCTG